MGAWAWQARVACCFSSEGGIGLRDGTFRLASRSGEAPELSSPKYQTIIPHQSVHPDMLVWKWVQKGHLRGSRMGTWRLSEVDKAFGKTEPRAGVGMYLWFSSGNSLS